jgi:uncharacterized protein (TIGR01777 family)
MPQRVAITGASGTIGSALSALLTQRGDEVVHLVRRRPVTAAEIPWDPSTRTLDPADLAGVDAVVHLAGASVERRWTPKQKHAIFTSRVDGTHTIATAVARADHPIRLVSQSGTGFYGSDRGEEVLTEESAPGTGFIAEMVQAWEAAADPARDAGQPVVHTRTGVVLSCAGAVGRMLPWARLGLGGPIGSGRQLWSWITLHDTARGLAFLLDHAEVEGVVNLVGARPDRQRDVAAALGRALHRPTLLPAPAFGVRIYVGEFASEVLGSQRVSSRRLVEAGFSHDHETLDAGLAWVLDRCT